MDAESKACPVCGETIKAAALKCRFCGEDLRALQEAQEAEKERLVFTGSPAAFYDLTQYLWAICTFGVAALYYAINAQSTRYEITSQRIKVTSGTLSKTSHTIELYRVDDYVVIKPWTMRVLGFGVLYLRSTDRNTPRVYLVGLPNVDALAEDLRGCSLAEKKRRGVRMVANA